MPAAVRRAWVLALATLLLLPGLAAAQPTRAWVGVGVVGGATSDFGGGLGLTARLGGQRTPHHVELRAVLLSDIGSFPDGGDGSAGDLSLLYGRVAASSLGSVAIAGGPSLAWTDECPRSTASGCYTIGLAFSADVAIQSRLLGIGLQALGNLNSQTSFAGVAVMLYLGWMPG